MTALAGLLLAAGGGRRMGGPKVLLDDGSGAPLAGHVVHRLRAAGCAPVTVVVGAASDEAAALLRPYDVEVVVAEDWATGMAASLRAGLEALSAGAADAALVTLVDLPDVDERVMSRVVDAWREAGAGAGALLRAAYGATPGHPVLIGRQHWPALVTSLEGDVGAREYLAGNGAATVAVGDLATGRDVDRPEDLLEG